MRRQRTKEMLLCSCDRNEPKQIASCKRGMFELLRTEGCSLDQRHSAVVRSPRLDSDPRPHADPPPTPHDPPSAWLSSPGISKTHTRPCSLIDRADGSGTQRLFPPPTMSKRAIDVSAGMVIGVCLLLCMDPGFSKHASGVEPEGGRNKVAVWPLRGGGGCTRTQPQTRPQGRHVEGIPHARSDLAGDARREHPPGGDAHAHLIRVIRVIRVIHLHAPLACSKRNQKKRRGTPPHRVITLITLMTLIR